MEGARQKGTKREETQTTRMKRNREGRDDDQRGRGKDYYELRQSNTGTVLKRGSICGGEGVKVTGSGGYVLQKVWGEWREVESRGGVTVT